MAKKFSGFSTSITPDKTSTSQFIVGYSGQDNAQWTINSLYNAFGLNGFITASSTDTLTNKSGSNSQWTNDEGYITSSSLPTVNNSTITLVAGTGLTGGDSFTLNQGSDKTITFNASGSGTETIFSTNPTSTIPTGQVITLTDSIKFESVSGSLYGGWVFKTALAGIGPNEYATISYGGRTFLSHYRSNEGWAFGGANTSNSFHFNTGTTTMSDGWSMRVHGGTNDYGALIVKGVGLTSSTTALSVQDSGAADIFNVTDDGEVKIESNLSNYTGFRIKASNGSSGINQTAYISDNFSGTNLQDIKPFITKKNGAGAIVRNTLFLGPASDPFSANYFNAGHTVVNGPWSGGTPSFNTLAGYFAPMITSSMFIAGGGNETGLFIGSGGQDSSHYALQVRSDNSATPGDVYFQLRGDNRIVYKDGNEAVDKVLTCDADGVATWQTGGGGSSIYTANGDIPTATNREVTLTGTATLFFRNVRNQGDFRIGGDDNAALPQSNYSIKQDGSTITHYSYQSSFNVGSNSDPSHSGFKPGTNWLYVSHQGLEQHNQSVGIGDIGTTSDRLVVKGRGITSATYSVRVSDFDDTEMFTIKDNGSYVLGTGSGQSLNNEIKVGAKLTISGANAQQDLIIKGGHGSAYQTLYTTGSGDSFMDQYSLQIRGGFENGVGTGTLGVHVINTGRVGIKGIANGTDSLKVHGNTLITGQARSGYKDGIANMTFNWDDGNIQKSTATGAQTFSATNPEQGSTYILMIGTPTVNWNNLVKWPGGTDPVLAGTTNIITLLYDGTSYYGTSVLNYS